MPQGTVIFLNGPSSSGKTTLARSLQDKLPELYYHIAGDTFSQMAPRAHRDADFWAVTHTSMSAMHHTIALFSDLGLGVIVDHVILDTPDERPWLLECVQLFHTYPVLFVCVECPIEELERRERQRGDRRLGQARAQVAHLHGHGIYDLTVNTYAHTVDQCADMIVAALRAPATWSAFWRLADAVAYAGPASASSPGCSRARSRQHAATLTPPALRNSVIRMPTQPAASPTVRAPTGFMPVSTKRVLPVIRPSWWSGAIVCSTLALVLLPIINGPWMRTPDATLSSLIPTACITCSPRSFM